MDTPSTAEPDWGKVSEALHTAGTEIGKLENLPLIKHGEAVVAKIDSMSQEMQDMKQEAQDVKQEMQDMKRAMAEQFARVEAKFDLLIQEMRTGFQSLSTRITATDTNAVIRNQNSFLGALSDQLVPLVNPLTNTPVANFPASIADINKLDEDETDALLKQLNQQTADGTTLAGKKRQLKMYIGLG
ncbi:hypothetical protein PV08_07276 [Exophiala spinifera]|uniref:Uncharacterized protein n=1 Tax=Exophiala spinifera TaxID=91928 RepID=A0A0D1ZNY0_9EURO|nr:uncharacterized protein PV08_07276 [Exophiala spinifera]KIW14492.1 hypothetical protein PV08_07276 [Exophiala spinifera]